MFTESVHKKSVEQNDRVPKGYLSVECPVESPFSMRAGVYGILDPLTIYQIWPRFCPSFCQLPTRYCDLTEAFGVPIAAIRQG